MTVDSNGEGTAPLYLLAVAFGFNDIQTARHS